LSDLAPVVARLRQIEDWKKAIRSDMFAQQLALHDDPARKKACHSGRRAGKSEGIPRSCLLDLLDAGPQDVVLLGGETLKKAKSLYQDKVRDVVNRYRLPFSYNGQEATWTTPWGAKLHFWGAKDEGAIALIRGLRLRSARFDEVATFASRLPHLVDQVVMPALGDLNGGLSLYGTPSVTCSGGYYDICAGKDAKKWKVYRWDARQNPYFRNGKAEEYFAEVLAENGWDPDNATYLREYMGFWRADPDFLVYRYVEDFNDLPSLPEVYDVKTWSHTMAVDFGYEDDCAWVVLASHPHRKDIVVVDCMKQNHLIVDEVAEITAKFCAKYQPSRLIGDGAGKSYTTYWNSRFAGREFVKGHTLLPMLSADKLGKRAHIDLVNTEFRTGRMKLLRPTCDELAGELSTLPWKDGMRALEHPSYDNHLADALLYAYMAHYSYLNSLPVKTSVKTNRPDDQEQIAREEARYRERQGRDWYDDGSGCAD